MADGKGVSGWSGIIATWVSIAGAFGGGIFGLQTYSEEVAKQQDARVVQTFELLEMFNSAERLEARAAVFDHIWNDTYLESNDLYVMMDFFDALQICVERNLCERDLAIRLFQSYAVPFWGGMDTMILNSRTDSDPNFGAGLQWLAAQPVPPPLEATPASTPEAASPEVEETSDTNDPEMFEPEDAGVSEAPDEVE